MRRENKTDPSKPADDAQRLPRDTRRTLGDPTEAAAPHPWALVLVVALIVGFAGCAGPAVVDDERAQRLAALPYPEAAETGPSLDIVAVREDDTLRLVNRTPDVYRNVQLWLNRRYVMEVDRIDIGDGNIFALPRFINRYQEPYPVGWLLAPEKDEALILTELYDPAAGVRYPLLTEPE